MYEHALKLQSEGKLREAEERFQALLQLPLIASTQVRACPRDAPGAWPW